VVIKIVDQTLPLIFSKLLDGHFPAQQKLLLIGCFVYFGNGVTPLFLMTSPCIKTLQPKLLLKMDTGFRWI